VKKPIRSQDKVVVFGAGLVGTLLGILLAKRGFRVEIHEKRPDLRYKLYSSLRSINLALSHRGWTALALAGLEEKVRQLAIPMKGRVLHGTDGNEQFFAYGRDGQAICSVSRYELNCLLLEEAETYPNLRIYFESKAEKFSFDKSVAYVADVEGLRQKIEGDAFFGADGAFSTMRYEMMREDRFNYQQHYIEHGYKEFTIRPDAKGTWAIRPEGLHIWPRKSFMMIALPNQDFTFTATLFFPFEGEKSFQSIRQPEQIRNFFEDEFPDFARLVPDFIQQYRQAPDASLVTIRCAPWNKSNFLLLGDAAHAIVPFYGQGMIAGFEDCHLLMEKLDEGERSWQQLFDSFYQSRNADAMAISELALDNFIEMRDLVASEAFQLERKIEKVLVEAEVAQWIPLYTMVTFTNIPYAEAQERGRRQGILLKKIRESCDWSELSEDQFNLQVLQQFHAIASNRIIGEDLFSAAG
jgi:kynurenine 3-monooxygenase